MNLNAVKFKFIKGMIDKSVARFGHNAFAFKSFSEPVAGPTNPFLPINTIVPNDANKFITIPNASYQTRFIRKLLLGRLNEL